MFGGQGVAGVFHIFDDLFARDQMMLGEAELFISLTSPDYDTVFNGFEYRERKNYRSFIGRNVGGRQVHYLLVDIG